VRYLLLIASDEKRAAETPPDQQASQSQAWGRFTSELQTAGKLLGGERLRPTATATTIRQPNGRTLLSDGPFTESKEQLGGYYLVEAENLDEAVAWASKMPHLPNGGSVEIRPIWELGAP
jgi:hypothetical protein